ncbi:MAG: hypothetical protein ACP5P3_09085 [Ignavibacteria bacterium]
MINFTANFFQLDLLKISEIKLHETTETYRLRNIYQRIATSKFLMNPVIVGKYKDDYILLDGANRLASLKEIGCKLILAQIIDYLDPKIKLRKWNHLVYNFDFNKILKYLVDNKFKHQYISYREGEKKLKEGFHYVMVTDIGTNESIIIKLAKNLFQMVREINLLTRSYFNKYPFDRSEEEIKFYDLVKYSRKKGILFEFPSFTKEQVLKVAKDSAKIPAGITRHILNNRVLHIRYEISMLKSDDNLTKKREALNEYLNSKIDNNKVRQYRESVIIFDE